VEAPGVESGTNMNPFDLSRAVSDATVRDPRKPVELEDVGSNPSRSLDATHCSIEVSELRQVIADLDAGLLDAARDRLADIVRRVCGRG